MEAHRAALPAEEVVPGDLMLVVLAGTIMVAVVEVALPLHTVQGIATLFPR